MKNSLSKKILKVLFRFKIARYIAEWIWGLAGPCNRVTELISESNERKLTLSERWHTFFHKSTCSWCTAFDSQTSLIRETLQSDESFQKPSESLSSAARARILKAVRDQSDDLS